MVNLVSVFREHWVNVLVPLGFVIGIYLERRSDEKLTSFRNKSLLYSSGIGQLPKAFGHVLSCLCGVLQQEGSLCAQHCLNNLLQGEYFSPVELSSIAHQLDEEERMRMAEGGVTSQEYRTFLEQPSGNMDDSGFFSIQVISNALGVWGLELILFNSPDVPMESAMEISTGFQTGPVDEDEENLRKALALSRQDIEVEDEEADLRRAIQLSMLGAVGGSSLPDPRDGSIAHSSRSIQNETLTAEELRKRRQAYFDKQSQQQAQSTSQPQPEPQPQLQLQPQPQLQPQVQQESKSTDKVPSEQETITAALNTSLCTADAKSSQLNTEDPI
ncbi:UNVERIFIED_CONTAM: hypothetical protein FKN15_031748 [Acipenser sinensis]